MKMLITTLIRFHTWKWAVRFFETFKGTDYCSENHFQIDQFYLTYSIGKWEVFSKSLEEMAKHVNEQDGEIREMFTAYSLLLPINEHVMQLNRAIDECRREYEILIDAVIDSQRGVIQPQRITPTQILEQIKTSQADMPSDLSLPNPASATYLNWLLRIVNIDVILKGKFLVYVIRRHITNNVTFNL